MRFLCNFLLAEKLKKKSSNNSSAALGIGCSLSKVSNVSAEVESVFPVSIVTLSSLIVFLSEHAPAENRENNKISNPEP